MRPRRVGVVTAAALLAGPVAAPSHATERRPPPRRIVENLDRGPVAVPSGEGTFLSRRLLGTEYALPQVLGSARTGGTPTGDAIAFNVYKGGRRLDGAPGHPVDHVPGRRPGHRHPHRACPRQRP
ncbi:hypothetical protein ABT255_20005 [Streptomyces mirabilis]|uniref:rhamnogalacturonan endolyase family protein n=1 Tax=Streptomyces TaxID=1883 RepID=UPI000BD22D7D|nr:hypothetical protein [Streptomyces sp. OK228]SOE32220.1 hypothetical protein SAMN05442782_9172 [Streptomyces sp. OK228]